MDTQTDTTPVLRVKNPDQSPPDGWAWKEPSGDKVIRGGTLSETVSMVTGWLIEVNGDAGNVEAEIHQTTAKALLSNGRRDLIEIHDKVNRSWRMVISGGMAAVVAAWEGNPIQALLKGELERGNDILVDQAEADRRARVCCEGNEGKPCDANVIPIDQSKFDEKANTYMLESVAGNESKYNDDLDTCKICSCELKVAVWWKPKILAFSMKAAGYEKKLPAFCWKRKLNT